MEKQDFTSQYNRLLAFCYGDKHLLDIQLKSRLRKYQGIKFKNTAVIERINNLKELLNLNKKQ